MKLIHLSDLHLGKRVNEFSMLEDQEYILKEILGIIDEEHPEAVLLAGDIYDKSVPPAEAVLLFDGFLTSLSKRGLQVFLISGNHDSSERLSFGCRIMEGSGIHISPLYDGTPSKTVLSDEFGQVNIYMLPFLKPAHVKRFFPEEEIDSYQAAVATAVHHLGVNPKERNVIMTHQFVTGALRSDSEEVSVGGSDNIDAGIFDAFDYVALGHIHRPQSIKRESVRYSGTPLKYSFSEANHEKSVTIVNLNEKGNVTIGTRKLVPMRDMHKIRGTYEELTAADFYKDTDYRDAYIHVTLTDEEDIPDAIGKLRSIYKNIMKLEYDNKRTRSSRVITGAEESSMGSPIELFCQFYEKQNNQEMSPQQRELASALIGEIWEEEK